MAYDTELADRVRAALSTEPGVTEKAMFGGLAFLVHGAMAVAANRAGALMVRCDPAEAEQLLATDGVRPVVMRGREMRGWLHVDPAATDDEPALVRWLDIGRAAARAARP